MAFNSSAAKSLLATLQRLASTAAAMTRNAAIKEERDKAFEAKLRKDREEYNRHAEKILRMTGHFWGTSGYTQNKFLDNMGIGRDED